MSIPPPDSVDAERRPDEQEVSCARRAGREPLARTSGAVAVCRRRVLFALAELDYPTPALRRAAAVATALDGALYILRVLGRRLLAPPSVATLEAVRFESERVRLARQGTAAWWARTLLRPFADENIQVRVGDFASEVSAHADALAATCVILAPTPAGGSGRVAAVQRACRQPVLSTPEAGEPWAQLLAAARGARSG